jgi:hypothetical protein
MPQSVQKRRSHLRTRRSRTLKVSTPKEKSTNGDAQLEDMISALNECVASLAAARKPQLYKKAELKVALLQRCMQALVSDIEFQRRGWAAYSERKLDQIHDTLLDGAIAK